LLKWPTTYVWLGGKWTISYIESVTSSIKRGNCFCLKNLDTELIGAYSKLTLRIERNCFVITFTGGSWAYFLLETILFIAARISSVPSAGSITYLSVPLPAYWSKKWAKGLSIRLSSPLSRKANSLGMSGCSLERQFDWLEITTAAGGSPLEFTFLFASYSSLCLWILRMVELKKTNKF